MSESESLAAEKLAPGEASGDSVDGRVLRGARNRQRIVLAFVELLREGNLRPTAEQVAERAAVGTRTVFRHFDDMESLLSEISGIIEAEIQPLLSLDTSPSTPIAERIDSLVARRAALFEKIRPFKQSAATTRWRSHFLQRDHAKTVVLLRRDLLRSLPEVEALDLAQLEILDVILSYDAWERLRADQHLGRERARAAMEAGVLAILEAGEIAK